MKKLLVSMIMLLVALFVNGCANFCPFLAYDELSTKELMLRHMTVMGCHVYYDKAGGRIILPTDAPNQIVVSNCTRYMLVIEGGPVILDPGLPENGNWSMFADVYSRTPMTLKIKVIDIRTNKVIEPVFSTDVVFERYCSDGYNGYNYSNRYYSFVVKEEVGWNGKKQIVVSQPSSSYGNY